MRSPQHLTVLAAAALLAWLTAGCVGIPAEALRLGPEPDRQRQLQTRRYEGIAEADLLAACAAVLQDLGFTLEESETRVGLVTASKRFVGRRGPTEREVVIQVAASALVPYLVPLYAYEAAVGIKEPQIVRVSLVARPATAGGPRTGLVRVTFQRVVYQSANFDHIKSVQPMTDPATYQAFFERLSQSVFLEAQSL